MEEGGLEGGCGEEVLEVCCAVMYISTVYIML